MKQRVLTDISVTCEPPHSVGRYCRDKEHEARLLKEWAKELEDFVRDHRSQDAVSLIVEERYEEICSHCRRLWEEDEEGPTCCAEAKSEHVAQV